jgi:hypothetical protein
MTHLQKVLMLLNSARQAARTDTIERRQRMAAPEDCDDPQMWLVEYKLEMLALARVMQVKECGMNCYAPDLSDKPTSDRMRDCLDCYDRTPTA